MVVDENALRKVVREEMESVLQRYGTDVKNPLEAQADARFARQIRRAAESTGARALAAAAALLVVTGIGLLVAGIRSRLPGLG